MKRLLIVFVSVGLLAFAEEPRVIVGFEQSGAISAMPVQKLFIDAYASEVLSSRFDAWGDVRLTTLPQPVSSTIFTIPADIASTLVTTPVVELVRSGEFLFGGEYHFAAAKNQGPAVSLIADAGAAVPSTGNTSGARFLRQYGVGLRITSGIATTLRVDAQLGQNEAVTGGHLAGPTARFDAMYGVPVSGLGIVYFYGTAAFKAYGAAGQDLYRVGVGLDLVQLLNALRNK